MSNFLSDKLELRALLAASPVAKAPQSVLPPQIWISGPFKAPTPPTPGRPHCHKGCIKSERGFAGTVSHVHFFTVQTRVCTTLLFSPPTRDIYAISDV